MPPDPLPTKLSEAAYRSRGDATLAAIELAVDRWLEADVIDIDSQRTGGMLEMRFPNGSVIVVNLQPPLQELWLAARSGGFHFHAAGHGWQDTRSGRDFFEVLSACASEQAGTAIRFEPSA